ncbi:MAG: hypothetical protein KDD67_06260 [Ignavibacteriae bacterium]|nr:hypothetical protein [Ignavibacteriota bacterium]MCB9215282.1 hypothetical protein [Ignavibacteria bacterium]
MNAFLPGIGIPGYVSIAPSGQSNWWVSMCGLISKSIIHDIKVFTKEARNYRAAPGGSSDTWPSGKPEAAPHGHDMLFESSALKGRLSWRH